MDKTREPVKSRNTHGNIDHLMRRGVERCFVDSLRSCLSSIGALTRKDIVRREICPSLRQTRDGLCGTLNEATPRIFSNLTFGQDSSTTRTTFSVLCASESARSRNDTND